jgi:ribonuclease HI
MTDPHFYMFTDGSCGRGKNDLGAWAAFVIGKTDRKLLYGAAHPATVSRMEMTPILEGLRWIQGVTRWARGLRVRAYSDSEFVVKTLSSGYEPTKNMDLWAALKEVGKGLHIEYRWQGRNSNYYMQLCDAVCSCLRKRTIAQAADMLSDWRETDKLIPVMPLPVEEDDTLQKGLINAYSTQC